MSEDGTTSTISYCSCHISHIPCLDLSKKKLFHVLKLTNFIKSLNAISQNTVQYLIHAKAAGISRDIYESREYTKCNYTATVYGRKGGHTHVKISGRP